ncbi:site-2 protease family protein [Porcipelethomonas sp.]|uniref:site-2 protease family protein n=1 Tax=Porcipelethomonas sp. TaxID=2981675 RepID=UPI003EF4632B
MNFGINDLLELFTKVLIIFLILPVHEYAHAWAAHKMGDDTAAYAGRLTMNPLAHIDIFGAICLILTGFGWAKPVPINPLKFKKQRLGVAVTAAAGPLSNLLVALIAFLIYRILTASAFFRDGISILYTQYSNIDEILNQPLTGSSLEKSANGMNYMFFILFILECFIVINIGLAIFNLIPIPPLDGSKILSYFTSAKFDRWISNNYMIVNIVFMLVIITGVLNGPLGWIRNQLLNFLWFITGFIPKLMGA